ncbi:MULTISPECIES: C40 family peptidase [unclassified Streptomyces]|uniref:C40 family peptidase n=1 Tax=unclassified Streptomyces TaxID=2593676 RepID=UPI00223858D8|nr:C40 family peptidase [Streptomyces sp. SHP 1-2]MCW5252974.1 C40 family peptidase [Streptomyces sp. SHP 1-2]
MSHTAHIRSHRKPRRSASTIAMRAGVAGGVLSTLAVAGASGSANAAAPAPQTLELPILTADLAAQAAQSADATQQAAAHYELRAERDAAATRAAEEARADLVTAKKKAAEARKKAAEAARKEAAERASRTAERAALAAPSAGTGSSSGATGSSGGAAATATTVSAPTGSSTATGSAAAVIAFVKAQVGDAYVPGGTGPNSWDCSGLTQAAFRQINVDLPRVSQAQSTAGTQVSLSNLQPGDILYWGGAGSAYHVAVYVGDGMFVGAQNPASGVVMKPLSYDPPTGAVRVL